MTYRLRTNRARVQNRLWILFLLLVSVTGIADAQVGPMPPPQKPVDARPVNDKLKDSFKHFFGNQPAQEETKTDESGGPAYKPNASNPATQGDDPARREAEAKTAPKMPANGPMHAPLLTQPPLSSVKIEDPQIDPNRPPKKSLKVDNPANPLGLAMAVDQIKAIELMIKEKRFDDARNKLLPLRQWLIDCTEAHIGLYTTLNKIPTARGQSELEKQLALEFAQLRDRAMFTLGLLYVEEKDNKHAVKELVEVIKSQPKSKTGIIAYELLQEIGFTEQLQLSPGE